MNSDVDEAMFKHYGMSKSEENDMVNKPKICRICDLPNSYDSEICSKCGKPLSLEIAIQREEQEENNRKQLEEEIKDLKKRQVKLENSQKEYESIKPELDKMVLDYFEELGEDFFKKVFNKKLAKINL